MEKDQLSKNIRAEQILLENYALKSYVTQLLTQYALLSQIFSGDYNDLINKPNISASFSGDYNDLINLPDLFSGSYSDLSNKPNLFNGNYNDLANKPDLSVYALVSQLFNGNYNDLTNKPDLSGLTTSKIIYTPTVTYFNNSNISYSSVVAEIYVVGEVATVYLKVSGISSIGSTGVKLSLPFAQQTSHKSLLNTQVVYSTNASEEIHKITEVNVEFALDIDTTNLIEIVISGSYIIK